MAARKWTDAQRAKQSALINTWQPWQHSTGPKTSEGKAIISKNAHRGYFRSRQRLGQWLLWAKYHTCALTPELITETIVRADKLNIQLSDSKQHRQFFNDMATANVEAVLPMVELSNVSYTELWIASILVSAARKTVLGKY